jgi:hypothetical protein
LNNGYHVPNGKEKICGGAKAFTVRGSGVGEKIFLENVPGTKAGKWEVEMIV